MGRKRHGGRRANRGTPVNPCGRGLPSKIRRIVNRIGKQQRARVRIISTVLNTVSAGARGAAAALRTLASTLSDLEASLTDEQRHRIRCDMRYDREIADARARGWTDTAAAIEAERAEWLAGGEEN